MRTHSRGARMALLFGAAAFTLAAVGCGNDVVSAPTPTATDHDDIEATDPEDDHESFTFGSPADAADADRTIAIAAVDIAFGTTQIEVAAGEVITFVVTNTGSAIHDFTLGDQQTQDEHEAEMQAMPEGAMHDDPNAMIINPGETQQLTWRFAHSGDVLFGCHQPGHYDAGMVGTITVTE